jgi:phosphoglycerate-specific signal transduction histidine kinase
MNTRTYRYMLDRMSKDLIALTLEINDLTESLRSKKQIMEDEANKKILARENKLQSNYRY